MLVETAREQNRFWATHDALYKLDADIDPRKLKGVASALKLPTNTAIWETASAKKRIDKDIAAANTLHLRGTPSFLLSCPDGRVLHLASLSNIDSVIKK